MKDKNPEKGYKQSDGSYENQKLAKQWQVQHLVIWYESRNEKIKCTHRWKTPLYRMGVLDNSLCNFSKA